MMDPGYIAGVSRENTGNLVFGNSKECLCNLIAPASNALTGATSIAQATDIAVPQWTRYLSAIRHVFQGHLSGNGIRQTRVAGEIAPI
jgi:hypothetical protein